MFQSFIREKILNRINRLRLKNKHVSLLSNNCNGALILHDLRLRFNSPFVNLWLFPNDFVKYIKNIKHYMDCELQFEKYGDFPYPVARLDDIYIFFQHYKNEAEARRKWEERTRRIDLDNLWILMTERDGCTFDVMKQFDDLPYKHKVLLTHLPFKDISSSCYVSGFEKEVECGILSDFIPRQFLGRRYYDRFDYVAWLNSI